MRIKASGFGGWRVCGARSHYCFAAERGRHPTHCHPRPLRRGSKPRVRRAGWILGSSPRMTERKRAGWATHPLSSSATEPRIHAARAEAGWILGSSPRMTGGGRAVGPPTHCHLSATEPRIHEARAEGGMDSRPSSRASTPQRSGCGMGRAGHCRAPQGTARGSRRVRPVSFLPQRRPSRSAFFVAYSSSVRMPFACRAARRSILAKISSSESGADAAGWAVAGWPMSAGGCVAVKGWVTKGSCATGSGATGAGGAAAVRSRPAGWLPAWPFA